MNNLNTISFIKKIKLFFSPRVLVVTTHTPGDWCKPGEIYQWRESRPFYLITEVKPVAPTSLINGGCSSCFEIWGIKINE